MESTSEHRHASVYDILCERLGGHKEWRDFTIKIGGNTYSKHFSLFIFHRAAQQNIGMGMRTLGNGTEVRTYPRKWLVSEVDKAMNLLKDLSLISG